jgi:predicted TIM-barrel fold metal-dependent hydrolase
MTPQLSLAAVPLIDNHGHAGAYQQPGRMYRTVHEHRELYTRGFMEAQLPAPVYRAYVDALHRQDAPRIDEISRTYRLRELTARSLELWSASVFMQALRIGCLELYEEWDDQDRLDALSVEARRAGIAPLYDRVLDLANTPIVLTDLAFETPRMDRSLWSEKRYKWVSRIDPFLYPFGPRAVTTRGTEIQRWHAIYNISFQTALAEQGLDRCPTELADYVAFVDKVLDSLAGRGAIAFKIASAYVRTLEFLPVEEPEAARVFRALARGNMAEGRVLEDYMARRMLLWAADHHVPVQIHVGMGNGEPGMDFYRNNPLLLQSFLMDEHFRHLKVVLLHGAYPYCSEAGALAWTYGNVYLDFSWLPYLRHRFLVDCLTEWVEFLPAHKMLFGIDTGLPELHLGATRLGVRAVEAALSRGLEDGLWTNKQAEWLGERICFRNAAELYGLSL